MKIMTIVGLMMLSACTTSKPIYTPSGSTGRAIDCSGIQHTWNSCFAKASEICWSRGYDVVERSDQQGIAGGATRGGAVIGSTYYRTMIIQCKNPP